MDGKEKRSVSFNPADFQQFDHGYAVTGARLATDVTKTAAINFTTKVEQPGTAPPSKAHRVVQVHEYNNADSQLAAVTSEYVSRPERTVIVAPDRTEREELTQLIRADSTRKGTRPGRASCSVSSGEKTPAAKCAWRATNPKTRSTMRPAVQRLWHPHDSEATVVSTKPAATSFQFNSTPRVKKSPTTRRSSARKRGIHPYSKKEVSIEIHNSTPIYTPIFFRTSSAYLERFLFVSSSDA